MNFSDYITHVDNEEDLTYLKTTLFDVNLRILKSSPQYRKIVQRACNYVKWLCGTEMKGYKKPHGMSGANAAIPWNIIAYQVGRNTENEYTAIMINPKITVYSQEKIKSMSNCGSIRLKESIEIERSRCITVKWYDIDCNEYHAAFDRNTGALTIQHEIDHNNGILITDRVVKKENYVLSPVDVALNNKIVQNAIKQYKNESKKNLCSGGKFPVC